MNPLKTSISPADHRSSQLGPSACAFCDRAEIRDREIHRNDLARAFPTNIPIVPGHVLICPIRCVKTFESLDDAEIKAIFDLLAAIKSALVKEFGAEGFNCAWNEGAVAGQSVPHLHLHVVPRQKGDAGIHSYEPREFLYRPGTRLTSQELELRDVAMAIRKHL
jgi:histidine triad (HIT) family protein